MNEKVLSLIDKVLKNKSSNFLIKGIGYLVISIPSIYISLIYGPKLLIVIPSVIILLSIFYLISSLILFTKGL